MTMPPSTNSSLQSADEEDARHTTTPQILEIETSSPANKKVPSPLQVQIRFVGLCTLGLLLTLSCPQTVLYKETIKWYLIAKIILGYILTLASFFLLQGSDPGYLNPELLEHLEDADCQSLLNNNHEDNCDNDPHQGKRPESGKKETMQRRGPEGKTQNHHHESTHITTTTLEGTRRRYCPSCRINPPLRSHHCKDCDKCVATFDHHCHFVGTCIAERNHCRFWWYLLIQAMAFNVACGIVGTSSWGFFTLLVPPTPSPPWSQLLFVIVAKWFLYPLRFCAWLMVIIHSWMAVTNSTTFELSKGPRHIDYLQGTRGLDLPFSKGMVGNLNLFCCVKDAFTTRTEPWRPILWQPPGKIIRDSENWWENPWQNKYWSCC